MWFRLVEKLKKKIYDRALEHFHLLSVRSRCIFFFFFFNFFLMVNTQSVVFTYMYTVYDIQQNGKAAQKVYVTICAKIIIGTRLRVVQYRKSIDVFFFFSNSIEIQLLLLLRILFALWKMSV